MIPSTEPGSSPHAPDPSRSGWLRRIHRQLGLALVPWVLGGGAAAIAINHTSGFAMPCQGRALAADEAGPAARRAWGHLLAKASLAGERVELVDGSGAWLAAALPASAPGASAPQWTSAARLENFALPEADRPADADAHLEFLVRGDGELWRCAVGLDGTLRVRPEPEPSAPATRGSTSAVPWAALVDVVACAMLLWGLRACVVLWRTTGERRSGLVAFAAGAVASAVFWTTI